MDDMCLTTAHLVSGLRCARKLYWELSEKGARRDRDDAFGKFETIHRLELKNAASLVKCSAWIGMERGLEICAVETEKMLSDRAVKSVWGGALHYENLYADADLILKNEDGSVELYVLRGAGRGRDDLAWALAFAQHTAELAGLNVVRAGVLHLDTSFTHPGLSANTSLHDVFDPEDCRHITVELIDRLPDVLGRITALKINKAIPDCVMGKRCGTPEPCAFIKDCGPAPSKGCVSNFYRMSDRRKSELITQGFYEIRDIPESVKLTSMQQRIRTAHITGKPYLSPKFKNALAGLPRPFQYLDFETVSPVTPLFPGTSPLRLIPFQWSLHKEVNAGGPINGNIVHSAYLPESAEDPREGFIRELIDAIDPSGAIFTYTNYEKQVLLQLSADFPEYGSKLQQIAEQCEDLCNLVRRHLYHPDFGQSFSLKSVLPALAPDLAYEGLPVANGMEAMKAYMNFIWADDSKRRENIRGSLLDYCHLDTLALVRIVDYVMRGPERDDGRSADQMKPGF